MYTRRWSLSLVILLSIATSPLHAEKPDAPALGQDEKDLCSYLKDVDSKTDADCAPDAIAALKTQDPSAFAQKLQLAAKRKADVHRAYDRLKALSASDPANPSPAAPAKKDEPDPLRLTPPINDRTFPAWIGADAPDFKAVYGRWLQAQNAELEREQQGPVSDERRKQITAQLAHNQEKISSLEKIKDPAQLNCYLGDSCGTRGDVSGSGVVGDGSGRTWTAADYTRANAQARVEMRLPGGTLDRGIPSIGAGASEGVANSPQPPGGLPLLPLGTAGLGLGLAGLGVYRARKTWESENGLNPGPTDPTLGVQPVQPPTQNQGFSRRPLDIASDYVFRAKIFVEDHPYTSLGLGVGAVIVTGALAGPTLFAGGAGLSVSGGAGAAALAPAAVAVPAVAVPDALPVVGGAVLLMASDSKEPTQTDKGQSGETTQPDQGKPEVTFKSEHAGRHLEGTDIERSRVEQAIRDALEPLLRSKPSTGGHWGRVNVEGKVIEYRAYRVSQGQMNVGTYYLVK